MDEPTSALDPISTSKIEELAMELKEKYTIVIVTHNMQQAVRISDHTAFFLLGELVEYGETEKLFSQPQDKRTEDYITGRFGLMRSRFDEQLALLNRELIEMGRAVRGGHRPFGTGVDGGQRGAGRARRTARSGDSTARSARSSRCA